MGAAKLDLFSEQQNKLAIICKALGHPARIAILEYLLKVDACICGDIVAELPLAQPTISQHLKELKTAGLIKGTVEGTAICYCLDKKTVEDLWNYLSAMRRTIDEKNQCC
jgi:ArsR family transcriptional regulator, arsenate/arsenite/antimonite-responsive transcriptional repressor